MNKKLTSVLLAALMFGQPSIGSHVSANNTEFTSTKMLAQSNANQDDGFSLAKIALGIAGVTGLGVATAYLIHHFKGRSSEKNTTDKNSCDPKHKLTSDSGTSASNPNRRFALNDAVQQLYNSEYREHILSFSRERVESRIRNASLNLPTRSAITVTLVLNEAFRNATSNPSAIDLQSNERLFTVLNENIIKDCDDFTAALRGMVEISRNFATQAQPSSGAIQAGAHRALEIRSTAQRWLNRNLLPIGVARPLRSIKWHDHLCWLHTSILLFFNEMHYREFICNLTDDMFENKLISEDINEEDRAVLLAMWQLSDMFKDLARDPERGILCVDYGNTGREQSLIEVLKTAFSLTDQINAPDYYTNMRYGTNFDLISSQLYNLIMRSLVILELDNSELPELAADGNRFVGVTGLKIVHSTNFQVTETRGHHWLEISSPGQEQKLAIGELTAPGLSIEVERSR